MVRDSPPPPDEHEPASGPRERLDEFLRARGLDDDELHERDPSLELGEPAVLDELKDPVEPEGEIEDTCTDGLEADSTDVNPKDNSTRS